MPALNQGSIRSPGGEDIGCGAITVFYHGSVPRPGGEDIRCRAIKISNQLELPGRSREVWGHNERCLTASVHPRNMIT
jgi:hypothetical protein